MKETDKELPQRPPEPMPALGRLLNNAARHIVTIAESAFAKEGLSLPQYVVLTALWRCDGLMVSHLADYCGNGQPALSRLLDRMETKGLVERRSSPGDRRAIRVFLTDKSNEMRHLLGRYRDFQEIMMQGLDDSERAMLFELLERVIANGEAHNKSGVGWMPKG